MASEEDLDAAFKALGYLVLGYFLVVVGVLFILFSFAGSFSPGGFGPIGRTFIIFINALGFLIVVFSHVYYLNSSVLNKRVFGIPVKYVVILVALSIITLGSVSVALFEFPSSYYLRDIEYHPVVTMILVVIPMQVTLGIIYFNFIFVLAGLPYVVLFYYLVVRQSEGCQDKTTSL